MIDLERGAAGQAAQIIRGEVPTNLVNRYAVRHHDIAHTRSR